MKRGFTIIELLASLALLSIVSAALLGWMASARDIAITMRAPVQWRGAARATLQLLHDELRTVELAAEFDSTERIETLRDRLVIQEGSIRFDTRGVGFGHDAMENLSYILESGSNTLIRRTNHRSGSASEGILLQETARFSCAVHEDEAHPGSIVLHTILSSIHGETVQRKIVLP